MTPICGQPKLELGHHVPVMGPSGVGKDTLIAVIEVMDGPVLAKIYLGETKTWDDAAIKKRNPDVKLPSLAIAIVHRSDGSGTTYNFTYYLSNVSPDWKSKVGTNTSVQWTSGIWSQRQRGSGQQCSSDERLDRLCRVCLCETKPIDLHQNDQQGGQNR
jgi:ABC-type phosphate transport system substrate-binding protein